jgi:hypothetical protein
MEKNLTEANEGNEKGNGESAKWACRLEGFDKWRRMAENAGVGGG